MWMEMMIEWVDIFEIEIEIVSALESPARVVTLRWIYALHS
jgi:hypothetical protein